MEPILSVRNLRKVYEVHGTRVVAVNRVSFDVYPGEAVGLVGESGCGKTTIARCVVRLTEPDEGAIYFDGQEITALPEAAFRPLRKRLQMVFQDPTMSLNPRFTVRRTLSEPLRLHGLAKGRELDERLNDLLHKVGLEREHLNKRPHQLSGGQRQRVGIARAIATDPDCVVLDEPTSSLDMSVKTRIVQLLRHLQREMGMTYIFISHDLSTVRHLCNRVLVMYLGQIVESGPAQEIFSNPRHPYTKALISAIPVPNPSAKRERIRLQGEVSASYQVQRGCILQNRCPFAVSQCFEEDPVLRPIGENHLVACHRAEEIESLQPMEKTAAAS